MRLEMCIVQSVQVGLYISREHFHRLLHTVEVLVQVFLPGLTQEQQCLFGTACADVFNGHYAEARGDQHGDDDDADGYGRDFGLDGIHDEGLLSLSELFVCP